MVAAAAPVPLYAGFWRRGAAVAVDTLIMSVANAAAGVGIEHDIAATVLSVVFDCAYVALFWSSAKQATPGKMLFGIKVTDLDGERIGLVRAIARYFASWLSVLTLLGGFVMAAFTKRKRALHDIIAGTLVVRRSADAEEVVGGGGTMPVTYGVVIVMFLLVALPIVGGAAAAVAIPAYQAHAARTAVAGALSVAEGLKTEVAQAFEAHQPVKARSADISGMTRDLREATVGANGEITLRLSSRIAKGASIVLTPSVDASGKVSEWLCRSPDLPARYLPAACRH